MKKLISTLMVICLLVMPVAMSEDIERDNSLEVDETVETIELDLDNLEDGNHEGLEVVIPEELDRIDLPSELLTENNISNEAVEFPDIFANDEGITIGPDSDPESIRYIQMMLIAVHALPEGSVNGVYDDATRAAVEGFQRWVNEQNGLILEVTGLVDDLTRQALEYAYDHDLIVTNEVAISEYYFPDANFRKYISAECDTDGDGYLSSAEIEEVWRIEVVKYGIESLEGLRFFTSLSFLWCSSNRITAIDLSKNTNLHSLYFEDNEIETLDVSHNPWLIESLKNDGPVRSDDIITFYPPKAYDVPEPDMIFDNDVDIYANGEKLYGSEMAIVRNTGTITIGVGEKIWGIHAEEEEWPPYWVFLLKGSKYTCSVKSSNKKVAKGVDYGYVKGLKVGTAKITATATDSWGPGTGTQYTLKVKNAPSWVTLSKTKMTLNTEQDAVLKVKLPSGTASHDLEWISSNENVVSVDEGEVYGHNPGTATITVKTYNGKKATCKVTVIDPSVPAKVKLNKSGTVKLKKGKTLQLKATVSPSTAQTTLTWKTSNKKVATVTQDGLVKAKKKGTATITVRTKNGKTAKVKIKVE